MKAVMIMHPYYFRQKQMSLVTAVEIDGALESGDLLYDAVTKREYKVSDRGFPPTRSDATRDRLHWSREVAVSLCGCCDDADGRIIVDVTSVGSWHVFVCKVISKSSGLPVNIPTVASCLIQGKSLPCLFTINDKRQVRLLARSESDAVCEDATVHVSATSPTGEEISVELEVVDVVALAESGRIVNWTDEDSKCQMV